MANVYGLDTSVYPGKPTLDWYWWKCDFRFTGFYLGPAPYHSDQSWMNARDELAAHGWGFLPTYVGLQIGNRNLGVARGEKDGQQAARLMGQAGFPTQTICYLDLEDGTVPSGSYAAYIVAWVRTLLGADYVPGIYCSHRIADWCRVHTPFLWTFRIPYRTSGLVFQPDDLPQGQLAAGAHATQFRQNVFIRGNRTKIDLNVACVADPSNLASVMHALCLS